MDLLDAVEARCRVGRQHAREPGRETGADDDVPAALAGFGVEGEQRPGLVPRVAHRDDVGAPFQRQLGRGAVSAGPGQDEHVARSQLGREVVAGARRRTQRGHEGVAAGLAPGQDDELGDVGVAVQLPSGAGADCAGPDHDGAHYERSGPESSRQPPPWGGTPPLPRTRSAPATSAAAPNATRARRSALTATPLPGSCPRPMLTPGARRCTPAIVGKAVPEHGAAAMTLPEQFDAVLDAARQGAPWALTALYRELQPAVLRYLRAQEPSEGEDLASEVWIDVAGGLHRFAGDENAFRRWVFTIARRRLIDLRRRRTRRRTDVTAQDRFAERPSSHDVEGAALSDLTAAEAVARIHALLPPDQAEVVLLRVVGGLDVASVADLVGKRPGTVRVLQHRALRRLARAVGAEEVVTP